MDPTVEETDMVDGWFREWVRRRGEGGVGVEKRVKFDLGKMMRFRPIQFCLVLSLEGRRLLSLYHLHHSPPHHSQHLSLLHSSTIALRGLPFFRGFRNFSTNHSIGIKVISLNNFTFGLLSTL